MSQPAKSDPVRIGIVGPSWWVDYWHLPALRNHPRAVVVGVCGERERPADEVRAKYGPEARYFTDLDQMLAAASPDGVIVCTPNDVHHPASMAALSRGIHVTCEKPVALDAAQAAEMAAAARAGGLIGMTNFPYRDNPCVQAFRTLMHQGFVGTPLHVNAHYNGGYGISGPPNWRSRRSRSGAGILGDLGSHLIDLVRYITGAEFESVCAHMLTLRRDADGRVEPIRSEDPRAGDRNDDSCAFLAELTNGLQGILHTSWVSHQGDGRQDQLVEVAGVRGRLRFTATHYGTELLSLPVGKSRWERIPVEGVVTPDPNGPSEEDYFRPGRHTPTNTTYRWIQAIHDSDRSLTPTLEDGLRTQEVIDAVIKASAERRWVDVARSAC